MDVFAWLRDLYPSAQIARVELQPSSSETRVEVYSARANLLIGKDRAIADQIEAQLKAILGPIRLAIIELPRPELEPVLVADHIMQSLKRGVALERVLELSPKMVFQAGAKGLRLRLGGALGEHDLVLGAGHFDETEEDTRHALSEASTEAGPIWCEVWIRG